MDTSTTYRAALCASTAVLKPGTANDPTPRRTRRKRDYVLDDPLLSSSEAATEAGRALSTFWRDGRAGRLPPPYYATPRCPRWRRSEVRAALEATRALPSEAAAARRAVRSAQ